MCIICFLRDNYQYTLRRSSMLRSDRIEHTIDRYKYTFIDSFKNSINCFCEIHDSEMNRKINSSLAKIDIKDIFIFFDKLRMVYINWINTQTGEAIDILNELFETYKLLELNYTIQSDVFFRGRVSKDFISHWDMFHIPFNKRYLIENQRYSLNGQPLLYLSSSPYSVLKELGNTEDIKISSFRQVENSFFNVYENTNKFNNIIIESKEMSPKDYAEYILSSGIIENKDKVVSSFFQMILASCCSFERREDMKKHCFSEEYVLPQVLTLVLKQHNYDGVKYISTKAHVDSDIINSQNIVNVLYSNICLFTDYTEEQSKDVRNVYDRTLFRKFVLSNPLKCNESVTDTFFSKKDWTNQLDNFLSSGFVNSYENSLLVNIGNSLVGIFDFLKKLRGVEEVRYKDLFKAVELHSLLLSNIVLDIKENKLKK